MRKRFQKGSLRKLGKVWIAQWREDGHRRKKTLGLVSKMTKSAAEEEMAKILAPINAREKRGWGRRNDAGIVYLRYVPLCISPGSGSIQQSVSREPHHGAYREGIWKKKTRDYNPRGVARLLGIQSHIGSVVQHSGPPSVGLESDFRFGQIGSLTTAEPSGDVVHS